MILWTIDTLMVLPQVVLMDAWPLLTVITPDLLIAL
jgi:hypothetical protein